MHDRNTPTGAEEPEVGRGAALRVACVILLVALALATRLPYLTDTLDGWDPLQQALGLSDFDLANHTPHPPGAPTYRAVVRVVDAAWQDPTRSVLAAAVILTVLAGLAGWGLGLVMPVTGERRHACLVGLCLLVAPGLWFDSITGGSGAIDATLAAAVGLTCYRFRTGGRSADVVIGAILMGLLLGSRQNVNLASVCMLPLWLWSMWRVSAAQRAIGLVVLLLVCCAWLIPSVLACGGFRDWLDPLLAHARVVNSDGILFNRSPGAVKSVIASGLVTSIRYIGVLWIPLVCAVFRAIRTGDGWRSAGWRFAGWWLLPLAAGMFLAPFHLEEYVAVALPVLCYLPTLGLVVLAGSIGRWLGRLGGLAIIQTATLRRAWVWAGMAALVLCNWGLFSMANAERTESIFHPAT